MPLELHPATEVDMQRAVDIEAAAYAPSPFNKVLFPGPFPPDVKTERVASLVKELQEKPVINRWVKVIDTDMQGEQTIATAQWYFYTEKPDPSQARTFGPGCNVEACEMLFGGIAKKRERLMGERPYAYLRLLQTDPEHQRRGAGRMLVEWGIEEAKKLGLVAYLESSPEGHEMYKKCGFRDLELTELDMSKWGATSKHQNWSMICEP
ncbi:putative GNAT family acetyltransferase [Xylariaceae sp. FL0016]|nr:putative GNAT family acetyltransferase [Xylariaceae sp. FL0016]